MRWDLLRARLVLLVLGLLGYYSMASSILLFSAILLIVRAVSLAQALMALLGLLPIIASVYAFKVKNPRSYRIVGGILKFMVSIQAVNMALLIFAMLAVGFMALSSIYKEYIGSFTVTLLLYLNWRRKDVRRLYGITVEEIPERLSDEIELLHYIRERGGVYRRSEAARALGISLARVLRAERSLVEDGLIVYVRGEGS